MLTWKKVREWCREPDYPLRYTKWFWTALLATHGRESRQDLLESAARIAAQHRRSPDYTIGRLTLVCPCHMRPRFLDTFGDAVWEGDMSAAAWYHFPLVKAYLLSLLAGHEETASRYLMEFAAWRQNTVEAYEIAKSIGDLPHAHALARQIVDDQPQRVYFFCRRDADDPELLERAREGLIEDDRRTGLQQARFCAEATKDTAFLKRLQTAAVPAS